MSGVGWTDPMVVELRIMNTSGEFSCSQMARELNEKFGTKLSRNAVIGKLHRLGLTTGVTGRCRISVNGARKPRNKRVRRRSVPGNGAQGLNSAKIAAAKKLTEMPDVVWTHELDPATNVDLMALEDGKCKWPVNDQLYCGAPTILKRKSYCSIHFKMSGDKLRQERATENDNRWKSRPTRGRFF